MQQTTTGVLVGTGDFLLPLPARACCRKSIYSVRKQRHLTDTGPVVCKQAPLRVKNPGKLQCLAPRLVMQDW